MASQPFIKWYPTDWRADPKLRMCSLAARGLWIELIGYMHEGEPYGHLTINGLSPTIEDVSALVGRPLTEVRKAMGELEQRQVYSVDDEKRMFSRRMVRDKAKAERDKTNGADGGNPEIRRGSVPKEDRVRPYRRSDAPHKTMRIFQKDGGKCHWCRVDLIFNPDGVQPNGFHVDHVLPICDGGTNDEDNLVAACADCNHKRARNSTPTSRPDNVGLFSDVKAHIPEARNQKEDAATAPPDPEVELFRRGREVLGKTAGGLISKLLAAKQKNIALARAAIEQASTKSDPREYIGAIIRGKSPQDGFQWNGIEGVL